MSINKIIASMNNVSDEAKGQEEAKKPESGTGANAGAQPGGDESKHDENQPTVIYRELVDSSEPATDEIKEGDQLVDDNDEILKDGAYHLDGKFYEIQDGKVVVISDNAEEYEVVDEAAEEKKPDEELSDAEKKIKDGEVVTVKKKTKKSSPEARKARIENLKKARMKAHSPEAEKKRKKSMQLRAKKISDEVAEQIISDIQKFALSVIEEKYEVSDQFIETLADKMVIEDTDKGIVLQIPSFDEAGNVEFKEHLAEVGDSTDPEFLTNELSEIIEKEIA